MPKDVEIIKSSLVFITIFVLTTWSIFASIMVDISTFERSIDSMLAEFKDLSNKAWHELSSFTRNSSLLEISVRSKRQPSFFPISPGGEYVAEMFHRQGLHSAKFNCLCCLEEMDRYGFNPKCAAGEPGHAGIDGIPGEHGTPGLKGLPGLSGSLPGAYLEPTSKICLECPMGPPGLQGQDGVPGEPGKEGACGEAGKPGRTGPPGQPGEMGDPGKPGPKGPPGMPGRKGPPMVHLRGKPGARGKPGPRGEPGALGSPGETAPRGRQGNPGPIGRPGKPGMKGVGGEAGKPGSAGLPGYDAAYCLCPTRTAYSADAEIGRYSTYQWDDVYNMMMKRRQRHGKQH